LEAFSSPSFPPVLSKSMLVSFLIRLENLTPFSSLRSSAYVYPVVLALHLSAISLFGATIVGTDLRLLGWALPDSTIADLIPRLRMVKRIGFILAASCGFLLFAAKAEEYYYNAFFRAKMLLFALVAIHALVFQKSVYADSANSALAGGLPRRAKLAASISLVLWFAILCAGRAIGYVAGRAGMHYK
jgi:hypothetical protein